ncbi:RodZ domain-containing protein [Nevskia ramosa]|uniref:RodZ domain-containing protein n=1 Tax=Nevskia ramosa TaxID=64002 RepID=UPI003D0A7644
MTSDPIIPTLRVATETDAAKPDSNSVAPSAAGGPGRMIRTARERASMSIEELAVQTRLARPTLEALESDDFSTLHEAVYVRGYYRKCAKVLKLPEAELIGAYDKLLGPKAPPLPTKLLLGSDGSTMGSMSRRGGGPSLPLVLAIAVAVGVGLWFLVHESPSLVPTIEPTTPPPAAVVEPAPAPTSSLEAQPGVPASEFATPTPGEAPASGAAVTGTEPAAASAAEPVVAGSGALVLNFTATSWVRVDDADGRLLLSGNQRAGDHQVLRGRLPYALFIGYVPGVTIEFDGKPFDLKPHMRDNSTARISLPFVEPAAAPAVTP